MERTGQSRLGLASLGISLLSAVGLFVVFVFAGVIEASTPSGMSEESLEAMVIGLFMFGFIGLDLISIGLGIAGVFQKTRDRVTAIVGTVIATATVIVTMSLVLIGINVS